MESNPAASAAASSQALPILPERSGPAPNNEIWIAPRPELPWLEPRSREALEKVFGTSFTPIGDVLELVQNLPPGVKALASLVEQGKLQEGVARPASKSDPRSQFSMTVNGTIDGRPDATLSLVGARKSADDPWSVTYTLEANDVEPLSITQTQKADGSYRTTIQPPGGATPTALESTGPLSVDPGARLTIDGHSISALDY